MANKRFWLGILILVLVFGMTVVGCGSMVTNSGPDPRKTDGKGGGIFIKFTGTEDYWLVITRDDTTYQSKHSLTASLGGVNNFQHNVHDDCTVTLYYRTKRQNDDSLRVYDEDKSSWRRKSVYLTNDEIVEVTIP